MQNALRHLALRLAKGWPGGEHKARDVGFTMDIGQHLSDSSLACMRSAKL
jgi:hypothetical protein